MTLVLTEPAQFKEYLRRARAAPQHIDDPPIRAMFSVGLRLHDSRNATAYTGMSVTMMRTQKMPKIAQVSAGFVGHACTSSNRASIKSVVCVSVLG